jgi:hypothetical protein
LVRLGFELRALCLQSWHSITSASPLIHFGLIIWRLSLLNYLPWLVLNLDRPNLSLPNIRSTGMSHQRLRCCTSMNIFFHLIFFFFKIFILFSINR